MYRPKAYAVDDIATLHEAIRVRRFATIATAIDGSVQFAYAPVVLHEQVGPRGEVRFHLARANPLANIDGTRVRLSFLGPDAYISPDWYTSAGMVPTWNYIAVEGEGTAHVLDDDALRSLLEGLSATEEERLRPKTPWTLEKISQSRLEGLLKAIRGFAVRFDTLMGKFKLSQDKNVTDVRGVIVHLQSLDDPPSAAVAAAMQQASQR
jgi:transcriptional regulator